jgi:hypothetical protein
MKHLPFLSLLLFPTVLWAAPGLTIYNQNFAVVRDTIALDLKKGVNEVTFDGATLHLEPDSVILRDPSGTPLHILEQNYRNDPVTQGLLLSLFEGKEIDFSVHEPNKPDHIIKGTVIRSGYMPLTQQNSFAGALNTAQQPIIQVDGKIQFTLPGEPIFPSLGNEMILKPLLAWKINATKALKTDAELGYITEGMSWEASYNVVASEKGDNLDLIGWVTMRNQSGRDFLEAKIQLMAGDVNKIDPQTMASSSALGKAVAFGYRGNAPAVTEKTFDEYHLYTLERAATLRDRETKQVEFIRASGIKSEILYLYDGLSLDWNQWRGNLRGRRESEEFGTESTTKVVVMRELKNSKENGLGIPLPKGRVRFYRNNGSQLEFTGENTIDHTPAEETLRITTGDAFDLVGERKRTNFTIDNKNRWAAETFDITLRNHKKETVTIRVVEHLYRWVNWAISENSDPFVKRDAQQVEFLIQVKPEEEKKMTYKVVYSW